MKILVVAIGALDQKCLDKIIKIITKNSIDRCLLIGKLEVAEDLSAKDHPIYHCSQNHISGLTRIPPGISDFGNLVIANFSSEKELPNSIQAIDLLLTSEWPKGIVNGSIVGNEMPDCGSLEIAELTKALKPHYHLASSAKFFEREPYNNNSSEARVTRFIGLGDYGNAEKDRAFYAFNLEPDAAEDPNKIVKATKSPFEHPKRQLLGENNYFFETTEPTIKKPRLSQPRINDQTLICRSCGEQGHTSRTCPDTPVAPTAKLRLKKRNAAQCWFCLSNPNVESHLIISVISATYIAQAKGAISRVPVGHFSSTRHLQLLIGQQQKQGDLILEENKKVQAKLSTKFHSANQFLLTFEVYKGKDANSGSSEPLHHMHIQMIPVNMELRDKLAEMFKIAGQDLQLDCRSKLPDSPNSAFYRITMSSPDVELIFSPRPQSNVKSFDGVGSRDAYFDLQMPRKVLADCLGVYERADWKDCVLSEEEEVSLTESLRLEYVFE